MKKLLLIYILLLLSTPVSYAQFNQFKLHNFLNTDYNIINLSDSNFYSACVSVFSDNTSVNSFIIFSGKEENFFITDENFVTCDINQFIYPLVNFHFPFLTIKYNVVPYLYPDFVIKLFYILNKLKFNPRISDAMRSNEEQIKNKRRGWSNVESSPHLIGIAMDLSYYTVQDKNTIMKYASELGIHFLEHGGRGNRHIHLQDEEEWSGLYGVDVNKLSDSLNIYVKKNYNILKPYFLITEKEISGDDIKYNFYSDKNEIVKIEIENILCKKKAHISVGVFEPGEHTVYIHNDFLKKGSYILKFYRNNLLFKEKCFFIN